MIGRRIIVCAAAAVAFPLMIIGLLGIALWLAVDGDRSPVVITRDGQ